MYNIFRQARHWFWFQFTKYHALNAHVSRKIFVHNCLIDGLLAVRGNEQHETDMKGNGIENIDLLVMNLYPFEHTVNIGAKYEGRVQNINIGGPAMLCSAAKTRAYVTVLSSPCQYTNLIEQMDATRGLLFAGQASRISRHRTLFMIHCKTGKDISAYSAYNKEKEVGQGGRVRDEMSDGTKVNAWAMVRVSARAGGRVNEVTERLGMMRECEDEGGC